MSSHATDGDPPSQSLRRDRPYKTYGTYMLLRGLVSLIGPLSYIRAMPRVAPLPAPRF